jgi:hypothetical protein
MKELASKQNMNPITNQGIKKIFSGKLIISSFVYVFGGFFLILGIYVYVYYETNWIGWIGITFYPYRNYAIPMLIAGIALMITGVVTQERARAYRKSVGKQQSIANLSVCSYCGAKRDVDAQYCKKCGKKFE